MTAATERSTLDRLGILLAATICIAIPGVQSHVIGAVVKPFGDAYGWTRGDVAFALTLSALVHPFANITIGALADRISARAIALPGIAAFSLGLGLLGFVGPALWTWYAGYLLFSLLSSGVSGVIWSRLVVENFRQRRGLALATSLSGAALLVSLVPAIVLALDNAVGLRGIYPTLALISFVIMFIPAFLLLPREGSPVTRRAAKTAQTDGWRDIVYSRRLWQLGLALLLVASCVGTFIVHFQPMMTDSGISRANAATVAVWIGPSMVIGRICTGLLFDILPTRLVAATAFVLPGLACLWLWGLPLDFTSASVLAVLIGLGMGSEVDVVAYLSSRYFGLTHYGLVFAILISLYSLAIGTASWLVGKVYDQTGSYDIALVTLMIGIAAAVLLVLSLGRPPPIESEVA